MHWRAAGEENLCTCIGAPQVQKMFAHVLARRRRSKLFGSPRRCPRRCPHRCRYSPQTNRRERATSDRALISRLETLIAPSFYNVDEEQGIPEINWQDVDAALRRGSVRNNIIIIVASWAFWPFAKIFFEFMDMH